MSGFQTSVSVLIPGVAHSTVCMPVCMRVCMDGWMDGWRWMMDVHDLLSFTHMQLHII